MYKHENEKYSLMYHRVLTTVFNLGVKGDIRACKVYLDCIKEAIQTPVKQMDHTNNIQINNTIINQDIIQQLNSEQLNTIEGILKGAIDNKPEIVIEWK